MCVCVCVCVRVRVEYECAVGRGGQDEYASVFECLVFGWVSVCVRACVYVCRRGQARTNTHKHPTAKAIRGKVARQAGRQVCESANADAVHPLRCCPQN